MKKIDGSARAAEKWHGSATLIPSIFSSEVRNTQVIDEDVYSLKL